MHAEILSADAAAEWRNPRGPMDPLWGSFRIVLRELGAGMPRMLRFCSRFDGCIWGGCLE